MAGRCHLVLNGKSITANVGDTLINAALGGAVLIPYDCMSGQCQSCRVAVVSGAIDDGGTAEGNTVLACQARVTGDAEIRFDALPAPVKRAGTITEITPLSDEVLEVVLTTAAPLDYRPGQYVRLKLAGFPAREFSPTCRLDGSSKNTELVFHIRRLPDGVVSGELGTTIKPGYSAHAQGPFGQAYLREGDGPLVLVAGGTGWAPIWSLARAARATQPNRELFVVVGSRDAENLYMRACLDWLTDDGVREVVATVEHGASRPVRSGLPTQFLPLVGMEDTVYVAGPVGLVEAVKGKALAAGARCYADAFLPSSQGLSLMDRIVRKWRGRREAHQEA
jgi:3-phenylpropionate/trans-cinnamate dioxygenase ferredoxin reductase subunit